jgi:serine/threonine protein kinase
MSSADEIRALVAKQGKYEILSEFPDGANGHAFRARHLPLQREVFVKVCYASSESLEVFQEPLALMEATKRPGAEHLIELYDAERLGDEFVLFATELADGGNLLSAIGSGIIGQGDAIRMAIGILFGVAKLHASLLVHRDLKPANIMLFSVGSGLFPKVGDFGSVAALPSQSSTVTASRHSALYVPPEGWGNPSLYGTRSDLYQVGVVLHEMVNGPLPYDFTSHLDTVGEREVLQSGASSLEQMDQCDASLLVDRCLARRAKSGKILSMRAVRDYESKKLRKIIKKATAPQMIDRFGSAIEFLTALQSLDLPNWKNNAGFCEAADWKGWDWRINSQAGALSEVRILRRRASSTNYRKWGATMHSVSEAVRLVEDFSR